MVLKHKYKHTQFEHLIPRGKIPIGLNQLDQDRFEIESFFEEVSDSRRISKKIFKELKRVSEYRQYEIDSEKLRDILNTIQFALGELQFLNKDNL